VVFSDGKDEGSALSREELNGRITNLSIPIPIYSLAYTKVDPANLRNLDALSKNSFGLHFPIGDSYDRMQRTVEDIQDILQNDYVVMLRAYVPVDGETHALKIGIEYPSRSGKVTYQSASFEAIEPPPVQRIFDEQKRIGEVLKALPDNNPYIVKPAAAAAPAAAKPSGQGG
jgi:hypothetical protein